MNKYIFTGHCTRDPELRETPSGKSVCEIGIAVSGQRKEAPPIFWDVTFWDKLAEIAGEHLKKGKHVLVEGRIEESKWDDKTTGQKRSKMRVVGEVMQFLGGKEEQGDERPPDRKERPTYGEWPRAPRPSQPVRKPVDPDLDSDSEIPF